MKIGSFKFLVSSGKATDTTFKYKFAGWTFSNSSLNYKLFAFPDKMFQQTKPKTLK